MEWTSYHRLEDIHGYLDYLADTFPDVCSVVTIGHSVEGRPLKVRIFTNDTKKKEKYGQCDKKEKIIREIGYKNKQRKTKFPGIVDRRRYSRSRMDFSSLGHLRYQSLGRKQRDTRGRLLYSPCRESWWVNWNISYLYIRVFKELRLIGSTFLPSVGQVRVHVYERPFMEKEQEAFGGQSVHRCRS